MTVTLFAPAVADALQRNPEANPALGECYVMAQPKMRVRDVVVDAALADDGNNGVLGLGIVMKTHSLNPKTTRVYYELIAPRLDEGARRLQGSHARHAPRGYGAHHAGRTPVRRCGAPDSRTSTR